MMTVWEKRLYMYVTGLNGEETHRNVKKEINL
jgi:hypothetical protein